MGSDRILADRWHNETVAPRLFGAAHALLKKLPRCEVASRNSGVACTKMATNRIRWGTDECLACPEHAAADPGFLVEWGAEAAELERLVNHELEWQRS